MAIRKPTATVQLKVRLREDLRAVLEHAAKEKEVSLNQEIVDRLKMALTAQLVEANQNLVLAQLDVIELAVKHTSQRLERAEALLEKVSELANGGFEELANEIRDIRGAIVRGGIDPEDRK